MHDCTSPISPAAARPSAWERIKRLPQSLIAVLLRWQERAEERHDLESLNEHMLKDIGVSRSDALSEAAKPFWRE